MAEKELNTVDSPATKTSPGVAGETKARKAERRWRAMLTELTRTEDDDEEDEQPIDLSIKGIVGGEFFASRSFRKMIGYILFVTLLTIFYVSNRYACQQEIIEGRNLVNKLVDRRYKALTRSSQLKERMRRSYIEESLEDTTLQTAVTPSFYLRVDE